MKKIIWLLTVFLVLAFSGLARADVGQDVWSLGFPRKNNFGNVGKPNREFNQIYMRGFTASGVVYTLPTADAGSSGYQLTSDGAGTLTWAAAGGSTLWSSLGNPTGNTTIVFADNELNTFTFADTDADMFKIQGIGNFGNVSIVLIEQTSGSPSDGTVLSVTSADTDVDALVVTASSIKSIVVAGSGNLDLLGGTGTITYTDFVVTADGLITTTPDAGSGTGLSIAPSGVLDIGIDLSDAGIVIALSLGANTVTATDWSMTGAGVFSITALDIDDGNIANVGDISLDTITSDGTTIGIGLTAGDDITIGTSAGDVTIISDDVTFTVTDAVDDVFQIKSSAGAVVFDVDLDADDTITVGSGAQKIVIASSNWDVDNAGAFTNLTGIVSSGTANFTGTLDADGDVAINFSVNTEEMTITSEDGVLYTAAEGPVLITNLEVDMTTQNYLLRLAYVDDEDSEADYFACINDSTSTKDIDFKIEELGKTTIRGVAATDVLTLTAGYLRLTDGDIILAEGQIDTLTTTDETSAIVRDLTAASTAVFEVEATHTGDLGHVVLIDAKGQGAQTALRIDHAGDDAAVEIVTTGSDYTDDDAVVLISSTGTQANNTYLLRLRYTATLDANEKFLIMEDNAGTGNIVDFSAGGQTTWTLSAASTLAVTSDTAVHTGTAGMLDLDMTSLTNNAAVVDIGLTSTHSAATTQIGIKIDLIDDATAGSGFIEAININASDITPTSGDTVIRGLVIENTLNESIYILAGASQKAMVVDADATDSTETDGVFDIVVGSVTSLVEAFNIKFVQGAAGGTIENSAIYIELDSDGDGASDDLIGLKIDATDSICAGEVIGIVVDATDATEFTYALHAMEGDIKVAKGVIDVDTAIDEVSSITRAQATVTGPVFTVVEDTHTVASGYAALLIDQNTTTSTSSALEIDTEGAHAILFKDLVAAGDGLVVSTAASYTGQILTVVDTLVGTSSEGIIHIETTGDQAQDSALLRLESGAGGTLASATDGFMLEVDDNSAGVAGSHAVEINSNLNEALMVSSGKSSFTESIELGGTSGMTTPIVFEGSTPDGIETGLTVEDPTAADRTITLPDYTGGVPLIIAQGSTQASATSQTTVVAGTTLTLANGWFSAGKALKYTVYGTLSAGNSAASVDLYIVDAAKCTLTWASATSGDWRAEFILHAVGTSAQDISCNLIAYGAAAGGTAVDWDEDTHNMAAAAGDVSVRITSAHGSDVMTAEYYMVETWTK